MNHASTKKQRISGRSVLPFLAVVAMLVALPSAGPADDKSAPSNVSSIRYDQRNEELIRKMYADFVAGWNAHDAKAMSGLYAHDGDHVEPAEVRGNAVKRARVLAGIEGLEAS